MGVGLSFCQYPLPEGSRFRRAPGLGGGDQEAPRRHRVLRVENGRQHSALQLRCEHPGRPDHRPHSMNARIDHHSVVSKAARRQHVRRRYALVLKPGMPGHIPYEVVQQRPAMQIERRAGSVACLEERRTANRDHRLLEQSLLENPLDAARIPPEFSRLTLVGDPGIEVTSAQVDAVMAGFQNDRDVWEVRPEVPESRNEPSIGNGPDREDSKASLQGFVPVALRRLLNVGQYVLDIPKKRLSACVQTYTASATFEQRTFEMPFQHLDAMRNRSRCHVQFFCRLGEALPSSGRLEKAKTFQWWKAQHCLARSGCMVVLAGLVGTNEVDRHDSDVRRRLIVGSTSADSGNHGLGRACQTVDPRSDGSCAGC